MKNIPLVTLFLAASLVMPRSHAQTHELDHKIFFEHTKTKAEQGDVQAQILLGVCYANGQGVARNSVEAVKWYRKAAEQDIPEAQYGLGVCYDEGQGVTKDVVEAYAWANLAAKTDTSAVANRDDLEKRMSPPQLVAGRKRAEELQAEIEATLGRSG